GEQDRRKHIGRDRNTFFNEFALCRAGSVVSSSKPHPV
ncbi:MAG: hypothetical protein QOH44_1644, partial [Actinomycetota bacterium]|nr:hypothetical protein [Actinomycetota bacterium]